MDLRVIADLRERNDELFKALEDNGIFIEHATIPVGDYILSDRLCIERKTINDFQSSIIDGRLFEQIDSLKNTYELPLIILEGSIEEVYMSKESINGAICSIFLRERMQIIRSSGPIETAQIISTLARQEQIIELRMPSIKGGRRAYTKKQAMEYIIGNIPGIGPKLAVALLTHFKNIKNITNANLDELVKIDKIGRKKAEQIKSVLNDYYE